MRPRGAPRWAGVSYHHVAYRLLVKTRLRMSGLLRVVGEGADGAQAVALAREHHGVAAARDDDLRHQRQRPGGQPQRDERRLPVLLHQPPQAGDRREGEAAPVYFLPEALHEEEAQARTRHGCV